MDSLVYSSAQSCNKGCGSTCQAMDYNPKNSGECPSGYRDFVYDPSLDKTIGVTSAMMFWSDVQNIAIPKSLTYQTTIQKLLQGQMGWIGIYDPTHSALYNTVDKNRFVYADLLSIGGYSNFQSRQPDNNFSVLDLNMSGSIPKGEHWIAMMPDGSWSDMGYHFINNDTVQPLAYGVSAFNGSLACVSYLGSLEQTPIDSVVSKYCNGKTPCFVCGDGNETLAQCLTAADGKTQMCPLHSMKCDATFDNPLCPSGGLLNTSRDMCQADPKFVCGSGYTFDKSLDRCVKDVSCPDNGVFNTELNRCEKSVVVFCQTGYTLDTQNNVCYQPISCSEGGTYNQSLNKCIKDATITCPNGYTFNNTILQCEVAPSCDVESQFNTTTKKCEKAITKTCTAPYIYDQGTDSCTIQATCPSPSVLNTATDKCEYTTGSTNCPTGFSFDTGTSMCYQAPSCTNGGTYDTAQNLCTIAIIGTVCASGYTYNSSLKKCIASPVCMGGSYNAMTNRCEQGATFSCPDTSYTYNATNDRCEKAPLCSAGTYNNTYNVCLSSFSYSCDTANGYTYNATRGRCEKTPPICSAGTYNATTNRCETGNACSSGTWDSATQKCTTTSITDPTQGSSVIYSGYNGVDNGNYFDGYCSSTCHCIDTYNFPSGKQLTMDSFGYCVDLPTGVSSPVGVTSSFEATTGYVSFNKTISLASGDVLTFALTGGTTSKYVRMGIVVDIDNKAVGMKLQKPSTSLTYTIPSTGNHTIKVYAFGDDVGSSTINTTTTITKNGYQCPSGTQTVSCYPGRCNVQGYLCSASTSVSGNCNGLATDTTNGTCYTNPICPVSVGWSSSFDGINDVCYTSYQTQCSAGTYDASLGQCAISATCTNGLLDGGIDKCYQAKSTNCPTGYSQSGSTCYINSSCQSSGILDITNDVCTLSASYTCPSGYGYNNGLSTCSKNADCASGSLNTSSDRCEQAGGYVCQANYVLNGTTCSIAPLCSSGGAYNNILNQCQGNVSNICNGIGFSVDVSNQVCTKEPLCQNGSLNTARNLCQASPQVACGGYLFDITTQKCQLPPSCQSSVLNTATSRCENSINRDCGTYTLDQNKTLCIQGITCPQDSKFSLASSITYSSTLKKCTSLTQHDCASGYTYNGLPILSCEAIPICKSGVYNPDNDRCYLGDRSCPLGSQYDCINASDGFNYCSDLNCSDVQIAGSATEDTRMGADDKQNNGTLDGNGTCKGKIYIFNGKDMRCRPGGMQTGYTDCCKKGDAWFGLTQCSEVEKALGKYRSLGQMDGKCHYVGSYCASKVLGSCVQNKRTFCCYSGLLARIIVEQGREQLGITWGTPKTPICKGFSPEEFQKLDFSKMDLTEFTNDVQSKAVQSATTNLVPAIDAEINRFQSIQK